MRYGERGSKEERLEERKCGKEELGYARAMGMNGKNGCLNG